MFGYTDGGVAEARRHLKLQIAAQNTNEPALHITQQSKAGSEDSTQICPTCHGDGIARDGGYPYNGKCGRCGGSGKLLPC